MSVEVWMVPAVLVGLFVFLWAAAWFEGVVAPAASVVEPPFPEIVDTVAADAAHAESFGSRSSMPTRLLTITADMAAALDA